MKRFTIITLLSISILIGIASAAGIPERVTYQGRLTDAGGVVVPDGPYLIRFRLYDAASGGTTLWDSGIREIDVANGLFSYNLGDTTIIPYQLFKINKNVWVGTKVGVDPEITPRVKLTSLPYVFEALHSVFSDTAEIARLAYNSDSLLSRPPSYFLDWANLTNVPSGFADGTDDEGISQSTADGRYVKLTGDVMTGVLESPVLIVGTPSTITGKIFIYKSTGTIPSIEIKPFMTSHYLAIKDVNSGQFLASLEPDGSVGSGGYLAIRKDLSGTIGFEVDGNSGSFGEPTVSVLGSVRNVVFDMNATGDNSVSLPTDAISSQEMLDETGIVNDNNVATNMITSTVFSDIETVTITIPSSGYIVLHGRSIAWLAGVTGQNMLYMQVDETAGGGLSSGHWTKVGMTGYASTGNSFFPMSTTRTYFKTAGTYTFRLEAAEVSGNATSNTSICYQTELTAVFYPTAYGTVNTVSPTPGDHPNATAITVGDEANGEGTKTAYKMDLRYYELKARAAREAAQAAELELKQALESKDLQAANSNKIDGRQ